MLEDDMEITILREENEQLINKIEEVVKQNKLLKEELKACQDIIHNNNLVAITDEIEDKPLIYEQWLDTEEGNNLADAYAEAMNMNTNVSEEVMQ